jgi:hypothetical protein
MNKAIVRAFTPVPVILLFLPVGLSAKKRRGGRLSTSL